jgi:hypothetical protein
VQQQQSLACKQQHQAGEVTTTAHLVQGRCLVCKGLRQQQLVWVAFTCTGSAPVHRLSLVPLLQQFWQQFWQQRAEVKTLMCPGSLHAHCLLHCTSRASMSGLLDSASMLRHVFQSGFAPPSVLAGGVNQASSCLTDTGQHISAGQAGSRQQQ